jgi:hypothetical protein
MAMDPEELVTLTGHGTMKLRSAVGRAMMLPAKERKRATIVREGEPAILNFNQIKNLAAQDRTLNHTIKAKFQHLPSVAAWTCPERNPLGVLRIGSSVDMVMCVEATHTIAVVVAGEVEGPRSTLLPRKTRRHRRVFTSPAVICSLNESIPDGRMVVRSALNFLLGG